MTNEDKTCLLEGCNNTLNKGRMYCSRKCSNRAKAGLAADRTQEEETKPDIQMVRSGLIPLAMERALQTHMGTNRANLVLREIQSQLAIRAAEGGMGSLRSTLKPPTRSRVEIDSELGYYSRMLGSQYWADFRRTTAIGIEDIELMQRCGIMIFASRIKKSSIVTSLSNPRYWSVKSPNRKLQAIATANLVQLFQRHADDILLSLDYGSIFMEKQWAQKTAEELGVEEKGVGKNTKWWVVDKLHTAHPESVIEVVRKKHNLEFVGFTHERKHLTPNEILVKSPQALVITYGSKFGNIWGQSIFEPVYDYWYWYEIVMRSFMRYLERMGVPVAVCKAPSKGTVKRPDGTIVNSSEWAMLVAGAAGHSSAVYIPSDVDLQTGQALWNLEYLSADQQGAQFVEALQMLGTWIMRGMIVGDRSATQDSAVGSYAAALVHSGYTELDNDLIYKSLVGQINRWLMPDFGRYNVSPNNPPPVVLHTEGLDPREKDRIMKLVATAGNQKLGSGSPFDILDWETMFRAVDLPTLTEEQREEMIQKQTDEALEKQKKFNELQAETGEPAAKNPFGGAKPQPKPGTEPGEKAKPGQKLYEAFVEDGAPLLLSKDEAIEILRPHMQDTITLYSEEDDATDLEGEDEPPFGFSEPGEEVQLFNPYHDKLGRFASAKGAGSTGSSSSRSARAAQWARQHKGEIAKGAAAGVAIGVVAGATIYVYHRTSHPYFLDRSDATQLPSDQSMRPIYWNTKRVSGTHAKWTRNTLDQQEEYLTKNLSKFDADRKIYIDDYRGLHRLVSRGYHDEGTRTISLNSNSLESAGSRLDFRHTALHEQVHSRHKTKPSRIQNEASTELIARKMYLGLYGSYSPSTSYNSITHRLARHAAKQYPGDAAGAWKYINRLNLGLETVPDGVFESEAPTTRALNWLVGHTEGVQLSEPARDDAASVETFKLLEQGDFDGALGMAIERGDDDLVADILASAAREGIFFELVTEKDVGVQLFNPYHDEKGRFTTSPAGGIFANIMTPLARGNFKAGWIKEGKKTEWPSAGNSTKKVIFNNGFGEKDMTRIRKHIDKHEAYLKRNYKGGTSNAPISLEKYRWPLSKLIGGFYDPEEHRISLNVNSSRAMGKTGILNRRRGVVHAQTSIHEQIHAKGLGKGFKDMRGITTVEAATELTTLRCAHKMYGKYYNDSGYNDITRMLGNYAWRQSGGDPARAWALVGRMSRGKTGDSYENVFRDRGNWYGDGWRQMIETDKSIQLARRRGPSEPDVAALEAWELVSQGMFEEALLKAQASENEKLVSAILETAILHGVWLAPGDSPPKSGGRLESLQADIISLFNPYHDKQGV